MFTFNVHSGCFVADTFSCLLVLLLMALKIALPGHYGAFRGSGPASKNGEDGDTNRLGSDGPGFFWSFLSSLLV